MLKNLRQSFGVVGGPVSVLAFAAIVWGLSTLQAVAEGRQTILEAQAEALAEQEAALRELAKQRHPAHQPPLPVAEVFEQDDLDPLGRGGSDV